MSANDPRITESGRIKASAFLELRSSLFNALREIDAEIDKALRFKTSKRAAEQARQLFFERGNIADELLAFGVDVDPHPALKK
jgi:hypothetical protein